MTGHDFDHRSIVLPGPPAHIHLVGIGGIGVSGLARMLAAEGYEITGSDLVDSALINDLRSAGIRVSIGHRADQVSGAELVVTTAAASPDNPELVAARRAGVPVVKRAALLGLLTRNRRLLAVAGTHGKSTTSGMAALALTRAGLSPSFAVGAHIKELGANARNSAGEFFVAEADEYDFSFLWLEPEVAVVSNIEYDHPDMYASFEDVLRAFEQFIDRIRTYGTLVISAEDSGAKSLVRAIGPLSTLNLITFGEHAGDWRGSYKSDGSVIVRSPDRRRVELRLAVPGRHNVMNALAVLAAGDALDIDPQCLLPGLEEFSGVGRRFEVLFDTPELTVVSDYAHHPTEISATIAAARDRYQERRLVVAFQPHTYSRTLALKQAFASALDDADLVVLADIYPARETNAAGVSSLMIAELMNNPATLANSVAEAADLTRQATKPGDVILVMGAGDIDRAAKLLVEGAECR